MSPNQGNNNCLPYTTDTAKIITQIYVYTQQQNTYTDVGKIMSASGDNWSDLILEALINTLRYEGKRSLLDDNTSEGSNRNKTLEKTLGSPDRNIITAVVKSGTGDKIRVKALGIKMNTLVTLLPELTSISDIQKKRILAIHEEFQKIFPSHEVRKQMAGIPRLDRKRGMNEFQLKQAA